MATGEIKRSAATLRRVFRRLYGGRRYQVHYGKVHYDVRRSIKWNQAEYLAHACLSPFPKNKRYWEKHHAGCAMGTGATPTRALKRALAALSKKMGTPT